MPARQVEVYGERLRELGKPIEIKWFDAGNLGAMVDVEQAIAHQTRMMAFAERIVATASQVGSGAPHPTA